MRYKFGDSVSILSQGKTISGIVTFASNNGTESHPNWSVEILRENHSIPVYSWHQEQDGGRIYMNDQVTIEACIKCELTSFKVSQEDLEEACGYIDCDTCGTHLYPVLDKKENKCSRI